ncbi:MAG: transposase [Bifidobacterium scardovii]|nr:transposase [Bifidobacterium scardovii]
MRQGRVQPVLPTVDRGTARLHPSRHRRRGRIDSYVNEWCPQAEYMLDGFHIVSWMTGALDRIRKTLME